MRNLFLIFLVLTAAAGAKANAQLLYPVCAAEVDRGPRTASIYGQEMYSDLIILALLSPNGVLSCESARGLQTGIQMVGLAIAPAMIAIKTPGVREVIYADLASMGVTLANPVVLGVTVFGAMGIVTYYMVVKSTIEECRRLEIQEQIRREVEAQFGSTRGAKFRIP